MSILILLFYAIYCCLIHGANLHKNFRFQHRQIKNATQKTAGFCMFVIIQQLFTDMKTCGLDVHKDMIFCAIYDGKDPEVKKYDTFTPGLE